MKITTSVVLLLLTLVSEARGQPAADKLISHREAIRHAQAHLSTILAKLEGNDVVLDEQDKKQIRTKLDEMEKDLDAYARLLEKGPEYKKATAPLLGAAGAIIADDASGVGVADDILLPIVSLALIATYIKAEMTASSEVTRASQKLLSSSQALLIAVEMALAKKKEDGKCHCKCARLGEMGESLGRMTPGQCQDACTAKRFTVSICK